MRTSILARRAPVLAVLGGALWALLPAWDLLPWPDIFGLLDAVLPVVIIALALVGLHQRHATTYGRLGHVGFGITIVGLALMGVGNTVEILSLASSGRENELGHLLFFLGYFLVILPGAVLLGLAVRRADLFPAARLVGLVLVLVLPLSILLGVLAGLVAPPSGDVAFWVTMATGYGIAWVLLGLGMRGQEASRREANGWVEAT
jgi:hypothetical protein